MFGGVFFAAKESLKSENPALQDSFFYDMIGQNDPEYAEKLPAGQWTGAGQNRIEKDESYGLDVQEYKKRGEPGDGLAGGAEGAG